MNRDAAYDLVCEFTQSDSLRRHMRCVELAMRSYARKFGEDEDKWGIVGLLHDFDYERWPNAPDHPLKGSEILKERGYPEDVIYAIKSHADYLTDCPRISILDKTLYALRRIIRFSYRLRDGKTQRTSRDEIEERRKKDETERIRSRRESRRPSPWRCRSGRRPERTHSVRH